MKRIFFSENFIGKRKKDYFEGWYFRHNGECTFSFIAGISNANGEEHSFIQYIDCERSHYFKFDRDDFGFDKEDMTVRIGQNVFSKRGISVNIAEGDFTLCADMYYKNMTTFKKSLLAPSAMGVFSYLPMVCRHAVISMNHDYSGTLCYNGIMTKCKGIGYIEKDFGNRFPENYFWMHSSNSDLSIMFAVAYPLIFGIRGFICIISYRGKQYNLSLYTGAKLLKCDIESERAEVTVSKGASRLSFVAKTNSAAQKLIAPNQGGKMNIIINENLTADIDIDLMLAGNKIDTKSLMLSCFESVLKNDK